MQATQFSELGPRLASGTLVACCGAVVVSAKVGCLATEGAAVVDERLDLLDSHGGVVGVSEGESGGRLVAVLATPCAGYPRIVLRARKRC